jgi:hydrogenase nickel incorporation protein HypA/HybF
VVEAAFQQAFAHAAEGTEAEHATVDLMTIPAQAACQTCRVTVESHEIIVVCPYCGGTDLDLTGGDELILESIEYDASAGKSATAKE